jgi:putative FmdB family regulatory protein
MLYDYICDKCNKVYEIQHGMHDSSDHECQNCKSVLRKLFSSTFYVSGGMKPTLEDLRENSHKDKVKDLERAVRKREKAFGKDEVGKVVEKPDPRHLIKGRTLAGQQKEVDKREFIKAAAKDNFVVEQCQKALKKQK